MNPPFCNLIKKTSFSANGVLAAGLWLAYLLTGCSSTEPKYSEFQLPQPGPARVEAGKAAETIDATAGTVVLTNDFDQSLLEPSTKMFTLGPGDRLELELIGNPASRATTVVAPDGKLYFNLLPGVDVWGLTLTETKAQLENSFTNYIREQPRVAITLRGVESKRVWILGCVQAPGVYTMATPMTLLDSIAIAGGTLSMSSFQDQAAAGIGQELADLKHSFVLRQGKLLSVDFGRLINEGDASQNIYLQPDDFVYLPPGTAQDVYVLGAVVQPRPVPFKEGMTAAGAIAGAYGTLPDAYLSQVAVVRGSLSQPEITIVDYKKVIRGEARDVQLQPHDIVYVPLSPYRYLKRYAQVILDTFVSSSAINAGAYAVTKQQGLGTGVFIPVGSGVQIIPPVAPPPP